MQFGAPLMMRLSIPRDSKMSVQDKVGRYYIGLTMRILIDTHLKTGEIQKKKSALLNHKEILVGLVE